MVAAGVNEPLRLEARIDARDGFSIECATCGGEFAINALIEIKAPVICTVGCERSSVGLLCLGT